VLQKMMKADKTAYQSAIYAVAIFLQHATSIVMLPVYTRYLTPADYGIADLLAMGVEVVGLIVGVISAEAIFRFYFDKADDYHRRSVVFSIFITSLAVNAIGYLIIVASSESAAEYLFSGTSVVNGRNLILLYGATILFQVMSSIPMAYIRAQQKPVLFVSFAALRLALAVGFNLYFVVHKELHIEGVVYAAFSFTAIHGLVLTLYMLVNTRLALSLSIAKQALYFSWPLMLSSLALFLTTYGDRLFIKHYSGNSEVGLYSLAYKFGFILISMAWGAFAQAWDVRRYEVVKQTNAVETFQTVFRVTQMAVLAVALGLSLFAQDLLRIMASPDFHAAYKLVGIIVLAYVFNIWSHYCMFGILYSKKTKYKAIIDGMILVVALLLYVTLIPSYGALGAAWATLISLAVRFMLINYWSTRLYDMQLEWLRIGVAVSCAVLLYLISLSIQLPLVQSIFLKSLLMVLFISYVLVFGLKAVDRAVIFEHLDTIGKKLKLRE
jgi:O-antigen/teichoic acid export membrane protein